MCTEVEKTEHKTKIDRLIAAVEALTATVERAMRPPMLVPADPFRGLTDTPPGHVRWIPNDGQSSMSG